VNDRERAELHRAIGERFLRNPELHQMLVTPFVGVAEAVAAWVEQMDRQTLDVVAALDAKLVEMSRQIQSAVPAQVASVPTPRVEIFRPTLNPLVTQIEIPHHLPPTPAPVGGLAAPRSQPSVPDREQEDLAEKMTVDILTTVVATILASAIIWYAQTGLWLFEELLAYFVHLVQHLD
jgi:hypothetical protein